VRLLLLILFLLASRAAFAQVARPWPRNAATGKIEFIGHLPWPDSVRTEAHRQQLARRWYRQKLTNDTPAEIRRRTQSAGTSYAGVPYVSCYKLSILRKEAEYFNLCFELRITSDSTRLSYQIFDITCGNYGSDYFIGDSLENVLTLKDSRVQNIMEIFHGQLLAATKGL
jgi:hypothetical protein